MFGDDDLGDRPIAGLDDVFVNFETSSEFDATFSYVIYAATRFFATASDDSPASQPFRGTLEEPLNFKRSILGGGAIGVYATGDGNLVINNTDAYYDFLINLYAVDGREIVVRVGRPADAYEDRPILFKGTASGWRVDDESVTVFLRDNGHRLGVPAQPNIYGGTGGADGGSDLTGKRKPRSFGYVRNVEPPLVVPSLLIYQVSDGGANAVSAVYDRGAALTQGSDYASYALLAAAVPAAGTYVTCLAEGFFMLGSQPAGTVTADVEGEGAGSDFVYTTADIVRRLIATTDLVDPDDLYVASFTALNTVQPAAVGYWLGPDDTQTVADVVADLMGGIGGWAGFRRDGTLEVRRFIAPAGNPAASFDRAEILSFNRGPLPDGDVPPWRQRVVYQRAWTQQTDLASSVSASHKAFVASPHRLAEASDSAIRTNHPLARDPDPIQGFFRDEADAQDEADRLLALHRTTRSLYRMRLPRRALRLGVGDVIFVTYPRWDLTSGGLMTVVEINEDLTPPSAGRIDQVEAAAYG